MERRRENSLPCRRGRRLRARLEMHQKELQKEKDGNAVLS